MSAHAPILAAFDPHSAGLHPLEFAVAASRVTGAPLTVVAVPSGGPVVNWLAGDIDDSASGPHNPVEHLRLGLRRRRIEADVRVLSDTSAARGLERAMRELEPELVVLGAAERSAAHSIVVGSTCERVLHAATCPVAVVPKGYERPTEGVQTIGVAFAATQEGHDALRAAAALARAGGARLRAITVLDPKHADEQSTGLLAHEHHDADPAEGKHGRQRLNAVAELRAAVAEAGSGLDVDLDVLAQDAADGIVAASRHVDLLVMGSRAHGPKRAVLLGSVSRRVVERAACPVLLIPRGTSDTTEALLADAHSPATR
jgi:nucleotide-binding universal stress UspA family protein